MLHIEEMALNIEDASRSFGLDSGDPRNINAKHSGCIEDELAISATESKYHQCESSGDKNRKLYAVDETSEENSCEKLESRILKATLPVSNESPDEAKFSTVEDWLTKPDNDISATLTSAAVSKKSTTRKTEKISKRVRFNTEVETILFEPSFSVIENYNFDEEFTVENPVTSGRILTGHINRGFWKSESNLAIRNSPVPTIDEWVRYDRYIRNLRRKQFSKFDYIKFDDEDNTDAEEQKGWPRLKRTSSLFFRKKKNENEDGPPSAASGNLRRRFSKSMQNLKSDTKALMDNFVTKVMKRRKEPFTIYGISKVQTEDNISDISERELKSPQKLRRSKSLCIPNKKREKGIESAEPFTISDISKIQTVDNLSNISKRELKSTQKLRGSKSLKKKRERGNESAEPFTISGIPKVQTEDNLSDISERELKSPLKLRRSKSLYIPNKKRERGNESANAASENLGQRASTSVQNLKDDAKFLMDKFVTKVMKK